MRTHPSRGQGGDGLWLRLASRANEAMARLAAGLVTLGIELETVPRANMAFARIDDELADRLDGAGLLFYRTAPGTIRLVTSFQTTDDDVDDALGRLARLVG